MGLFDIFRKERLDYLAAPVVSPWADSGSMLPAFVWDDIYGSALGTAVFSRAEAIGIPAVSRGRNLIVGTIAQLPLQALAADGSTASQPTFLYRTDTDVDVAQRLAWTVDSLIFYGVALWAVKRGAAGQITDAAWVPHSRWSFDPAGRILVDGSVVDSREVILFNGTHEGLLNIAQNTLRGALAIEKAWVSRAKNPIPLTVIRHSDPNAPQLEQTEIDFLLKQWSTARKAEDGALGYLPPSLTIDTHGESDAQLFIEARNANRTDIANHLNIPTVLLDGSMSEASLTYSTTEGNRSRLFTETIPFWLGPIEARLSQDDVVPRGQRVRADYTALTGPAQLPTGAEVED